MGQQGLDREVFARDLAHLLHEPIELDQPKRIDREQQRMQQQHREEMIGITIGDEQDIAGERHDAQRNHGTHAESREHGRRSGIAKEIDPRIDRSHALADP